MANTIKSNNMNALMTAWLRFFDDSAPVASMVACSWSNWVINTQLGVTCELLFVISVVSRKNLLKITVKRTQSVIK